MKNVDGQVTWSDLGTQFMKTYPELSVATTEKTSKRSSKKSSESQNRKLPMYLYLRKESGQQPVFSWETDGPWHGELMTRNTGESPNDVVVSRLSQILEDHPHQKYFLSEKACLGILNRAERRGKDLPETLKLALMRQAGLTPSKSDADAMGGGKGPLVQNDKSATLSTSQTQTLFALEGNGQRASHKGDGYREGDVSYTLNTVEQHGVAYAIDQQGGKGMAGYGVDVCPTIASDSHGTPHGVAYNIGAYESNAWKSDNPHSGVYRADTTKTLDAINCGYPGCNQGGTAIVEPVLLESNQNHATVQTDGISTALPASMGMGGGYVPMVTEAIGVDAYNQTVTGDVSMSMTAIRSDSNHVPCVLDMTHANDVVRDCGDVVPTLQSRMGTGGNQVPLVMKKETNPCLGCDAYDEDLGCTMPSIDRSYACPKE